MIKEVENYLTKNYYELLNIAKKITKDNPQWAQDLLHEVIIQLYEKDKIILKKNEDCQIKYYIVAVMRINWHSKTSPFYYKVKREVTLYTDINSIKEMESDQEDFERELLYQAMETSYADLTWFHKSLMDLYLTLGSMKKVSVQTTIPKQSISRYISEAKTQIKSEIFKKINS